MGTEVHTEIRTGHIVKEITRTVRDGFESGERAHGRNGHHVAALCLQHGRQKRAHGPVVGEQVDVERAPDVHRVGLQNAATKDHAR